MQGEAEMCQVIMVVGFVPEKQSEVCANLPKTRNTSLQGEFIALLAEPLEK